MTYGFMVAAPSSGSGKTVVTLALLRALRNLGDDVRSAKSGPDYIDPAFHALASGSACVNLDAWAMRPDLLRHLASRSACPLVVEAAMGLYDGAADGTGSAADLAAALELPIVLVVDAARQSQSVAALVHGFATFRTDIRIAGVVLNRVGSARHEAMLRAALAPLGLPVIGALPRDDALMLPSRHLGLVQAGETDGVEAFITAAASFAEKHCDLAALRRSSWNAPTDGPAKPSIAPPAQTIAVARDEAFSFAYSHMLDGWRDAGAEMRFFSPLEDEPVPDAGAVYLPGGYPELHAGRLSSSNRFRDSLRAAATAGAPIYGECGGFMVLGDGIVDAAGDRHEMAGLLPVTTSFANRKRHLGYRRATLVDDVPFLGRRGQGFATHEFHYSTIESSGDVPSMAKIEDASGADLGVCGMVRGNVAGSYLHIIDRIT